MKWIKNLYQWLVKEYRYRKRVRNSKKHDPFIYK